MNDPLVAAGTSLELGLIGNCTFNALVDEARVGCLVLHAAAGRRSGPACAARHDGRRRDRRASPWNSRTASKHGSATFRNTAILETRADGSRWQRRAHHRLRAALHRPRPNVPAVAARAAHHAGCADDRRFACGCGRRSNTVRGAPDFTRGSHHIRYCHAGQSLRLTSDMPIAYAIDETWHLLDRPVNLLFGVDETVDRNVGDVAREFEERTDDYWRRWVRALALPPEWQDAVIRAAITLKLCTYEETGAIMAAVTTSIPEAPDTRAHVGLPLLLAARRVLRRPRAEWAVRSRRRWRTTCAISPMSSIRPQPSRHLQPVYGIGLEVAIPERKLDVARRLSRHRSGARRQPGVRASPARRLRPRGTRGDAGVLRSSAAASGRRRRLPQDGMAGRARARAARPARCRHLGVPHARGTAHVVGDHVLGRLRPAGEDRTPPRASTTRPTAGRRRAARVRAVVLERSWNDKRGAFVASFGGDDMDASVLLMSEVGFLPADDPRWRKTLDVVRRELKSRQSPVPLCRRRRLRRADDGVHRVHVLVRRRA